MTKGKLFLIDWDPTVAESRADVFRARGWRVEVESSNGGRAYRRIRTSIPDVVVVDLRKKPSHGREVGSALRELRATREVPIVCLEEEANREATRGKINDAIFATEDTVDEALEIAAELRASRASSPPSSARRRAATPSDGD